MRVVGDPLAPLPQPGVVVPVDGDLAYDDGDYGVVAPDGATPRLVRLRGASPAALLGVVAEVLLVR
jgi:hypothetical protein